MNLRPSGYEPDELPGCSTPRTFGCQMTGIRYQKSFWHLCFRFCFVGVFVCPLMPDACLLISELSLLRGPGGDLLSHALRRSTIGAEGFHGRVRDGIGCIAPRHNHQVRKAEDRSQRTEVRWDLCLSSDLCDLTSVFLFVFCLLSSDFWNPI